MWKLACIWLSLTAVIANTCPDTAEYPSIRSYFYVGGGYSDDGLGSQIWRNQMYVERLQPIEGISQDIPIILIHGNGQTGTNFLNTPDGRRGWASAFISQGYDVYIVDQTIRGRSPSYPPAGTLGTTTSQGVLLPSGFSVKTIQERFTAAKLHNLWPQSRFHNQWPGNGSVGDTTFESFYRSQVQFLANSTLQESTMQAAGVELLDMIGKPAVIFGHSQGGSTPILIADKRPQLIAGLVLLEPKGPPFREAVFSNTPARPWGMSEIPMTYDPPVLDPSKDIKKEVVPSANNYTVDCVLQAKQPPPRQLVNLANTPMLVVTSEASYHAVYDDCSVQFFQQAGCRRLQHLKLADIGLRGNGHMFFLEKNNLEIQRVIEEWIHQL